MTKADEMKMLKDRKVLEEIRRHQWIESEKAGRDIGLEAATTDWLSRFSQAWMSYHVPKNGKTTRKDNSA